MKNAAITILLAFCTASLASGQSSPPLADRSYFSDLALRLSEQYWSEKARAEIYALQQSIPVTTSVNGEVVVLERVNENGIPVYRKLYNFGASRFMNTDLLRPRAALALNLEGEGLTVGVWDGDNFKDDHIEFGNRAETRGSISDEPLGLGGNHSTHVTGTIAAAGINPAAKGMAPRADIFLYDFLNDKAEIASELAREEPLLVSNHSYGLVLGWQPNETGWVWRGDPAISNTEDYRFGFYDNNNSRTLDEMAFNAPYYLHVRAAGNDRTDVGDGSRPPDGPYDCIGPAGVAKNVLTVGAIDYSETRYTSPTDVTMSDFSSWGPTDDGRIKPDIVGPGVNILSTIAEGNNEYGEQSGTSMAAPAVAGSLILLQEQYARATGGQYMRAATLKGLIVHTAFEAGENDGPDYSYGWGVLSTDRASNLITARDGLRTIMEENVVRSGDSLVYTLASDGTAPLVATISWTDPPATPPQASLDPQDLMLINDLDIRVYDETGSEFAPWVLDPARPDREATTGDNFRDNVEKVEIPTPQAGNYTVVIRHKGTLRNDEQAVSVLISSTSLDRDLSPFYWVGGSGSWNDGSNWSDRSGGAAINQVPGIFNPVFFDDNSFASPGSVINFSGDAGCYNINYYSSQSCDFVLAGNTLNINGSLNIESDAVTIQGGTLQFTGVSAKMNFIRTGTETFQNTNLVFESENGTWNLENGLTAGSIEIRQSNVTCRGNTLLLDELIASDMDGNTLDFSGSIISGLANLSVDPAANASFSNSTFLFDAGISPPNVTFGGGGKTYGKILTEGISLDITGDNIFRFIGNNGTLRLAGSNVTDSLVLRTGSTLDLPEGTTQEIRQYFDATGTPGNLITIGSGPSGAGLFADNPNVRFCLDYLDVDNVSVTGSTGFLAGYNSTLNNSSGWIEIDCADALFPSFDIEFPCAGGETQFIDTSTGDPVSWNWNFGDPQFPTRNISEEQNPTHRFNFAGAYSITLNVQNDLFDQTITREIEILESAGNLSRPSVVVDGERLASSVIAPAYQWYFQGIPIPGASEQVYDAQQPGTYSVMISDEQCRFRSEETVVTRLEDIQTDMEGVRYYPNPVRHTLSVNVINEEVGRLHLMIYNATGMKIVEKSVQKEDTVLDVLLPLDRLAPGVYTIAVYLNDRRSTGRIILE